MRIVGLGVAASVVGLPEESCTPNQTVISTIESVISGFQQTIPFVKQLDPNLSAQVLADINLGINAANQLLAAAKSATGNTAHFLAQLIPIADSVLAALPPGLVPGPILAGILAGLGIVNVALNWLSNAVGTASTAVRARLSSNTASADMAVIRAFAQRPIWGHPASAK